jgi:hypothetical protein
MEDHKDMFEEHGEDMLKFNLEDVRTMLEGLFAGRRFVHDEARDAIFNMLEE